MAPKAGKTKLHKAKGEKKKKEEKVLPMVIEITVEIPEDSQVTLKGISTDRIFDVRKLLAVHVETCHLTNYSLSHEVRGPRLKDTVEIVTLKPCHLTIVEENYTEELAVAHIRRLLDIVACTTAFGQKQFARTGSKESGPQEPGSKVSRCGESDVTCPFGGGETTTVKSSKEKSSNSGNGGGSGARKKVKGEAAAGGGDEAKETEAAVETGDMPVPLCPPPKLGQFFDFFSFSHLTPPVQCG